MSAVVVLDSRVSTTRYYVTASWSDDEARQWADVMNVAEPLFHTPLEAVLELAGARPVSEPSATLAGPVP